MIISQQNTALDITRIVPVSLMVENCKGTVFNCSDRNYWRDAWRVVDARPVVWPLSGPKVVK